MFILLKLHVVTVALYFAIIFKERSAINSQCQFVEVCGEKTVKNIKMTGPNNNTHAPKWVLKAHIEFFLPKSGLNT